MVISGWWYTRWQNSLNSWWSNKRRVCSQWMVCGSKCSNGFRQSPEKPWLEIAKWLAKATEMRAKGRTFSWLRLARDSIIKWFAFFEWTVMAVITHPCTAYLDVPTWRSKPSKTSSSHCNSSTSLVMFTWMSRTHKHIFTIKMSQIMPNRFHEFSEIRLACLPSPKWSWKAWLHHQTPLVVVHGGYCWSMMVHNGYEWLVYNGLFNIN